MFAYVGLPQNLKYLKDPKKSFDAVTCPIEDTLLAGSAAIFCTGELDVIRNEAWSFYRTISGVRLCWELEEPNRPKVLHCEEGTA